MWTALAQLSGAAVVAVCHPCAIPTDYPERPRDYTEHNTPLNHFFTLSAKKGYDFPSKLAWKNASSAFKWKSFFFNSNVFVN